MQTNLISGLLSDSRSKTAEDILRSCVHCGFCNATCPTYLLLGDERDGPRGRIYLIKSVLEGNPASTATQQHLDKCLTCLNCETTCPSGVEYGKLLNIGREVVDAQVKRPWKDRVLRSILRYLVPRPRLVRPLLHLGNLLKATLPKKLRDSIPARQAARGIAPKTKHTRSVVLFKGCIQQALTPNTQLAAARVLDKLAINALTSHAEGCCGANDFHLGAPDAAKTRARQNIDAWWSMLEEGAESIVVSSSGCGAFIKDYAGLLADEPAYAEKAQEIASRTVDLVEPLADVNWDKYLTRPIAGKVAFQCPCTLQHAQKLGGKVERILSACGAQLAAVPDAHLCCGAAGSYSLTQADLSNQLRDQKLEALEKNQPTLIASANIACQIHLSTKTSSPVRHWIELVDDATALHERMP